MNHSRITRAKRAQIHVRDGHFRPHLLRLLAQHHAVRLLDRPDDRAWAILQELILDRIVHLNNTHGKGLLAVRGPEFARLGRTS